MCKSSSISILGCGWLGLPLAKSFITNGVMVKGSTTSPEKVAALAAAGVEPYLVHFSEEKTPNILSDFLDVDTLIICVPPGRIPEKQRNYFRMLDILTAEIDKSSIKKIIFISSTAVYGELNRSFSEEDAPMTDSEAGERMLFAEQLIASVGVPTVIVRLAGLIGPDRHPGRFFAGKQNVPNGFSPVNLVHLLDAIGVIKELVASEKQGVFNVCAPSHPTRTKFYSQASASLKTALPEFLPEKRAWKLINGEKVTRELDYKYKVPDLMQWVQAELTL